MKLLISLAFTAILYGLAFIDGVELAEIVVYWLSWLGIFLSFLTDFKSEYIKNGLLYNYVYSVVNLIILYFMIKLNQPVIAISAIISLSFNVLAIDAIRKKEGEFK